MRKGADLHSDAGGLAGKRPASHLHQVSQGLLRHIEEDVGRDAGTICLVQETKRQVAPVVDVRLLGRLCWGVQRLVRPGALGKEARLRDFSWVALGRIDAGDAVSQRHPDFILSFGDVHTVVIAQIQVAEEAGFKFDFCVKKSAQV